MGQGQISGSTVYKRYMLHGPAENFLYDQAWTTAICSGYSEREEEGREYLYHISELIAWI